MIPLDITSEQDIFLISELHLVKKNLWCIKNIRRYMTTAAIWYVQVSFLYHMLWG